MYTYAISVTVGFCFFVTDFVVDLEQDIHLMNENIKTTRQKKRTISDEIKMKRDLIEIIKRHSEAIELSVILV